MKRLFISRTKKTILFCGAILALVGIIAGPFAFADGTYSSGNYSSCQYSGCSITLTSNGTVNISVTPTSSGSCSVQSDSVSVLTDNSDGYVLTLNDSGTNTALLNGSNSVPSTSGTQASPTVLTPPQWGYRVDGVGGFGTGPTTAQSNVTPPPSTVFAGLPASNVTPDTIASTSTPADPAVTSTVWYGACTTNSTVAGNYSSQVTYTATANF